MPNATRHATTSDTPATPRGEQARQQLIQAATELFGEFGLKGATTREIAQRAEQNIAAITYYFNSKEGLYLAVAQQIANVIKQAFAPLAQEIDQFLQRPTQEQHPEQQLHFIRRGLLEFSHLMTQSETLNISKIMAREQLSPSDAYLLIHTQAIAPLHQKLNLLLAAFIGADANATKTILHTHALIGEVLAFRLGRETIRRQAGWQDIGEAESEMINQVLIEHIDLLLHGLRAKNLALTR
ncbi:bacterial regulatory s, tetR family protein [Yersinia rohdei]|uniref:Bacterial regulatory s, tetR family protein n=1 Tax=Yersinia rohdei TaxID=29485 RepID=A0A0U1HTX8_YERRO|nr:transcriptional regulator CecR [Yersinia rohdei]AJJ09509.1 bacterial regulatory s, tetR family protein [Yersinia rohdei]EEQ03995.1 TetR-family transcriptional regulator [Yersinia rohdei ATCC 43380]MDN0095323.1 transcriptional regulator CecR [Yersinia rohdei]CNI89884.1 putative DNA-binding transcriptional regulator [Yersinia rohdei]CQI90956.1 putative DNA-binding transcriptional regulator [Yersinia rohdei]